MVREEMYEKLKNAFIDGLNILAAYLEEKSNYSWFSLERHKKYPVLRDPELKTYPTFYLSDYEKVDYSSAIMENVYKNEPESWLSYRSYIINDKYLSKYFKIGKFYPSDRKEGAKSFYENFEFKAFICNFIDSYIHKYSKVFDESNFLLMFDKYYSCISSIRLPVRVIVPIILVDFGVREYVINDSISLVYMSPELQVSRNTRLGNKITSHPDVAGAATHAFVFSNIAVDNQNEEKLYAELTSLDFYKDVISSVESLIACLRILFEVQTGYCQIISQPLGWQRVFKADLEETFVVSEKKYPSHFEHDAWYNPYAIVSEANCEKIKNLYLRVSEAPKFNLAIQRLNKASLSVPDDDAIIDIAIAIESLLISSEAHGEIAYKLAVRAVLLNKINQFKDFSLEEIYILCKKIYNFRSSIVHGSVRKIANQRLVEIGGSSENIVSLAIKLLHHVIQTLAFNKQIEKAEDIDKLLFDK